MASGQERDVTCDASDACSLLSFVSGTSHESDTSKSPLLQSFSLKKLLRDDTASTGKSSPWKADSPVIPIQMFDGVLSEQKTLTWHHEQPEGYCSTLMTTDFTLAESSQTLVPSVTSAAGDADSIDNTADAGYQDSSTTKDLFSQNTADTQQMFDSFPQREEEDAGALTDTIATLSNKLSVTSSHSDDTQHATSSDLHDAHHVILNGQSGTREPQVIQALTVCEFHSSNKTVNKVCDTEHGGKQYHNPRHENCGIEMSLSSTTAGFTASENRALSRAVVRATGDDNDTCTQRGNTSQISHQKSGSQSSSLSTPISGSAGSSRDTEDANKDMMMRQGSTTPQNSDRVNIPMETPSFIRDRRSQEENNESKNRSHPKPKVDVETSSPRYRTSKSPTTRTVAQGARLNTSIKDSVRKDCSRTKRSVQKFHIPYNTTQNENVLSVELQHSTASKMEVSQNEKSLINPISNVTKQDNIKQNLRVGSDEPSKKKEENARSSRTDEEMKGRGTTTSKCGDAFVKNKQTVGNSRVTGTMKNGVTQKDLVKDTEPLRKKEETSVMFRQHRGAKDGASKEIGHTKGPDSRIRYSTQETNQKDVTRTKAVVNTQSSSVDDNDGSATQTGDSCSKTKVTDPSRVEIRGLVSQSGNLTRELSLNERGRIGNGNSCHIQDDVSDVTVAPHSVSSKENPNRGSLNVLSEEDSWRSKNIVELANDIHSATSKDLLDLAKEILIMEQISHVYGQTARVALEAPAKARVIQYLEKAIRLINKRQQQEKTILAVRVKRGRMTQTEKSDTKKQLENLSERCLTLRNLFDQHQKWKTRVSNCAAREKCSQRSAQQKYSVVQQAHSAHSAHITSAKGSTKTNTEHFSRENLHAARETDLGRDAAVSSSKEIREKSCAGITVSDRVGDLNNAGEVLLDDADEDQMSQSILLPQSLPKQPSKEPVLPASSSKGRPSSIENQSLLCQTTISKSVMEIQSLNSNRESRHPPGISSTISGSVLDLQSSSVTTVGPKSQNTQYIKQRPKTDTSVASPGQLTESPDIDVSAQDPANSHAADEFIDTGNQNVPQTHDYDKTGYLGDSTQGQISASYQDMNVASDVPSQNCMPVSDVLSQNCAPVSDVPTQHCTPVGGQHFSQQDEGQHFSASLCQNDLPVCENDVSVCQNDALICQISGPLSRTEQMSAFHDSGIPSPSVLHRHVVTDSNKIPHRKTDVPPHSSVQATVDGATKKRSEDDDIQSESSVDSTSGINNGARKYNTEKEIYVDESPLRGSGSKTTTKLCNVPNSQSPKCSPFSRKRVKSSSCSSEDVQSLQNDPEMTGRRKRLRSSSSSSPGVSCEEVDSPQNDSDIPQCSSQKKSGMHHGKRQNTPSSIVLPDQVDFSSANASKEGMSTSCTSLTVNIRTSPKSDSTESPAVDTTKAVKEVLLDNRSKTLPSDLANSSVVTEDVNQITTATPSNQIGSAPMPLSRFKAAGPCTGQTAPSVPQNTGSTQAIARCHQPAQKQVLLKPSSPVQSREFTSEQPQAKQTIGCSPECQQSRGNFLNPACGPAPRLTTPHSNAPRVTTPRLTTPHLTTPRLTTPHLTTPRLTTPRRPASPSSTATSMTDVFPVSSRELARRMALEAIPKKKDSVPGQREVSSNQNETPNTLLHKVPSAASRNRRPDFSSGDTDLGDRPRGAGDKIIRDGQLTDSGGDVYCSDAASIGSAVTNIGTQTPVVRQVRSKKLQAQTKAAMRKVSQSENLGLPPLVCANGRKPKMPKYSDLFDSGVVQPGTCCLSFPWSGADKRGTILADGRIKDPVGLTFTNPVSWYKAVTGVPSVKKGIVYSKMLYKGRSLAEVCDHFKMSEVDEHNPASTTSANSPATTVTSATISACPPPPPPPKRPRAHIPRSSASGANDAGIHRTVCRPAPGSLSGQTSQQKQADKTRDSEEQPAAASATTPGPDGSDAPLLCTTGILGSLRRLKLIKEEEIVPHSLDCEFSSFWKADFTKITMSSGFWATVEDWD